MDRNGKFEGHILQPSLSGTVRDIYVASLKRLSSSFFSGSSSRFIAD